MKTVAEKKVVRVRLSAGKKRVLSALEKVVSAGMHTFIQVGEALHRIQKEKLYRATHISFEAYCWEKFSLRKSHAYRKIASAMVAREVSPIGEPMNEYAVRPLLDLDTKAQRQKLWGRAVERVGDAHKVVAKDVLMAQQESLGQKLKNSEGHRKGKAKPATINRHDLLIELEAWFNREGDELMNLKIPAFFARVKKCIKNF